MYLDEIHDLAIFGNYISKINEEIFINVYKVALLKSFNETFLDLPLLNGRFLTAISPKFRNKSPLKYGLNNSQIILCLCHLSTRTNYLQLPFHQRLYNLKEIPLIRNDLQHGVLALSPHNLTQSKYNGFILDAVRFNCNADGTIIEGHNTSENIVPYSKSILQSEF